MRPEARCTVTRARRTSLVAAHARKAQVSQMGLPRSSPIAAIDDLYVRGYATDVAKDTAPLCSTRSPLTATPSQGRTVKTRDVSE